jgi:hypothetical protein
MPACHAVPCIRPAVAPLLATAAAMRGRIRREYVSLGGLAGRASNIQPVAGLAGRQAPGFARIDRRHFRHGFFH